MGFWQWRRLYRQNTFRRCVESLSKDTTNQVGSQDQERTYGNCYPDYYSQVQVRVNNELLKDHPILLFDGVCNFCDYWVNFAIKRDKKNRLRFTPIQGETAKIVLPQFKISTTELSSAILIDNGKAYTQSSAALRTCLYLNGGWKLVYGLMIFPKFLRDFVYNFTARNRYRWFGKKEECMVPSAEVRNRFLP